MSNLQRNPFARPATSWPRALAWSAAINLLLGAAVLWTYAVSPGADNPLVFYVAAILQFPGWLLFSRLFSSSIALTEAAVILVQVILLSIVIRKPWRRTTGKTA